MLESVINCIHAGYLIVDFKGNIIEINNRLLEIVGSPSKQETLKINFLNHKKLKEYKITGDFLNCIQKKKNIITERFYVSNWGKKSNLRLFYSPVIKNDLVVAVHIVAEDISETKTAQKELKENSKKFKEILEDIPAMVCRFKPTGELTYVNDLYCQYFCSNKEQLLGKNFFDFIPEEDKKEAMKYLKEFSKKKQIDKYEHEIITKDGKKSYQSWTDRAIFDDKGEIFEFQSVGIDITKEKQTGLLLQKSEEEFKHYFDQVPVALYKNTKDGNVLYANKTYQKMLGFNSLAELSKYNLIKDNLIKNYPRSEFENLIEEKKEIKDYETCWLNRKGKKIWTSENARVVKDEQGNVLYYEGMILDISQRKEAELALLKTEKKYQNLFNSVSIGIYRTTPDGKMLMCNPYMVNLLGYKSMDALKKVDLESSSSNLLYDRDFFKKVISEQGQIKDFESKWIIKSDGREIWVRESSKAVKDDKGNIKYYEGIVYDITKRKHAEDKLFDSYKHLGMVNRQVGILADLNKFKDINNQNHIFSIITKSALSLSNAKLCLLYRYNNDSRSFCLLDSLGELYEDDKLFNKVLDGDASDCLKLMIEKKDILKNHFSDKDKEELSFIRNQGLEFYINLPLLIRNELRGSLLLCFNSPVKFSSQEMDFFEVFAVQSTFLLMNVFALVDGD